MASFPPAKVRDKSIKQKALEEREGCPHTYMHQELQDLYNLRDWYQCFNLQLRE